MALIHREIWVDFAAIRCSDL